MKIQYKFVNETISIDVPDDWGEILIDLDRQEYNNDHIPGNTVESLDITELPEGGAACE